MTNRGHSPVQGEHNAVELPLYNLGVSSVAALLKARFGEEATAGRCADLKA